MNWQPISLEKPDDTERIQAAESRSGGDVATPVKLPKDIHGRRVADSPFSVILH